MLILRGLNARTSLRMIRWVATEPLPSSARSTPSNNAAAVERPLRVANYPSHRTLREGMNGSPLESEKPSTYGEGIDWSSSWQGFGAKPFGNDVQKKLAEPLEPEDIEMKPDGMIYLPEIKYRRILNKAFGAGGWGLVPRSETIVTPKLVTREYGLVCHNQLVSVARGEQDYFNDTGIPTATEGCKSNALMRCCKDLGIGSELWDPVFIKKFKAQYCVEKFVEHVTTKKKRKIWLRKDRQVEYPYK
ncbi:MGM101 (YJR144W) [Zygosaccharomyces parabailii]|uniref:Mitochondrial genome maintenance protein MGM101 n=1 Tax=Zygosaccharomyces bailii (strain CLIB 213 / ATCC 58445 / CBS 680 / BCRC 21525 / NBRC 1098 / NCYC 1416 / NRRL Y-2227) TaxID=1333698 RepID=A0A8J2TA00_ZYGB2|nr:MGM101 (YJR144W) [Zygosaccharomyces parabailii]CDF91289.1 ZYBA0S10-03972g1_1 [Zygosaccharomyces bailii CLIB 213]CDH17060.1 probable Mitochondrial genome maintenance protein MGM101 [Zygosaccharomyces bailii ISA1307]